MTYQIVKKDSFRIVGIRKVTPYAGGTWGIIKSDGSINKMIDIAGVDTSFSGLCFGFDESGNNDYMVGFPCDHEIVGFDSYVYPNSDWLVLKVQGSICDNVLGNAWKQVYDEVLPQSGCTQRDLPTIEKYIVWDEEKSICEVEIAIPVENVA